MHITESTHKMSFCSRSRGYCKCDWNSALKHWLVKGKSFFSSGGNAFFWDNMYFWPSALFTQHPVDYFYRLGDVVLMLWPTPMNRKPQFLWKSTRWKQIVRRENNILAEAPSGGQLDSDACMIYHFLYLLLCVWSCCVEHNDPWLKIELRLGDSHGAGLIRCLRLRRQPEIHGRVLCHTGRQRLSNMLYNFKETEKEQKIRTGSSWTAPRDVFWCQMGTVESWFTRNIYVKAGSRDWRPRSSKLNVCAPLAVRENPILWVVLCASVKSDEGKLTAAGRV